MKPAIHSIFALILGHMAIPQTVAAAPTCLPVETGDESTPIIHARINDGPSFAFVLDTAASGTTLAPTRAEALALPRDTATEDAQGMGGAISVYFHRVRSFKAGPVELRDISFPRCPRLLSKVTMSPASLERTCSRTALPYGGRMLGASICRPAAPIPRPGHGSRLK
jgi:hypothetical protein